MENQEMGPQESEEETISPEELPQEPVINEDEMVAVDEAAEKAQEKAEQNDPIEEAKARESIEKAFMPEGAESDQEKLVALEKRNKQLRQENYDAMNKIFQGDYFKKGKDGYSFSEALLDWQKGADRLKPHLADEINFDLLNMMFGEFTNNDAEIKSNAEKIEQLKS